MSIACRPKCVFPLIDRMASDPVIENRLPESARMVWLEPQKARQISAASHHLRIKVVERIVNLLVRYVTGLCMSKVFIVVHDRCPPLSPARSEDHVGTIKKTGFWPSPE